MLSSKLSKEEKLNSASDCFNNLLNKFYNKRTVQNKKFIIPHNRNKSIETKINFESFSIKKKLDNNFSEFKTKIEFSPNKRMYESPPQKNNLLFSLKLKKTTNLNRNNSLLKLLDLKLRVANNQDLDEIEDQSNQNPLFKVSNSSDFFKNTNCTENKTIYSTITKTNNNYLDDYAENIEN